MAGADPKEALALHRYFLWADQMRENYYALLSAQPALDPDSSADVGNQSPVIT